MSEKFETNSEPSSEDLITFLGSSKLFAKLNPAELQSLSTRLKFSTISGGTKIITEGDVANNFYLIYNGLVEVWKNYGEKNSICVSFNGRGDGFGELSLLDNSPRSATVIARENTSLLSLDRDEFFSLCEEYPQIMIPVVQTLSAMVRTSNNAFVSSLRDQNSKLQQTLEKLRNTQQDLIRAERFSNLGKLSSIIVHDLRNPLSVIQGYAEMLQLMKTNPEQVTDYATKLLREVSRMNQFTQELLDYSRGDIHLNLVFTSLPILFKKLQKYLQKSFADLGMKLEIISIQKEAFYIDENRILRALINLSDNAKKAMSQGGVLQIKGLIRGDSIKILVKDSGQGMDKDVLSHIFDPFFSTSKKDGTGLGMLSVKNIIEAHSGSVNIKSQKGKGTAVLITIPFKESMSD